MEGRIGYTDESGDEVRAEAGGGDRGAVTVRDEDYRRILDRAAVTVAEGLGEVCLIQLVHPDGSLTEPVAYHHTDATELGELKEVIEEGEWRISDPVVERVVRSRESILRADLGGETEGPESDLFVGERLTPKLGSLMIVPIRTSRGYTIGVMSIGRDRTEPAFEETDLNLAEVLADRAGFRVETSDLRRRLETRDRQLDEAAMLRDEFISIASHELRTPLGSLKLVVELLRRKADSEADAQELVDEINEKTTKLDRQVDRLSELIDRLVDIARLSGGGIELEREQVDLVGRVGAAVEQIRDEYDDDQLSITLDMPDSAIGRWDAERIDQIVMNLLSNAAKFGDRRIHIEVADQEEATELHIHDDGPGIATSDQEAVFERFGRGESAEQAGLGVGLWIVRELVERMGGEVRYANNKVGGTTFSVRLPNQSESGIQ